MQTFAVTKGNKQLLIFGLLFFAAGLLVCLIFPFLEPDRPRLRPVLWSCAVACFGFTWWLWKDCRRTRDTFEVDDSGMTRVSPDGSRLTITWSEITAVKPREKRQRLDVYDRSGKPVMLLDYQIGGFDVLRSLIYNKTQALYEPEARPGVFHKSRAYCLSLFVFFLIVLLLPLGLFIGRQVLLSIIFLECTLYLVLVSLREPWRVLIETNGLTVSSFFKSRKLAYAQIGDVTLRTDITQRGNSLATVSVKLRDDTEIKLTNFQEGSVALFHALHKAWQEIRIMFRRNSPQPHRLPSSRVP